MPVLQRNNGAGELSRPRRLLLATGAAAVLAAGGAGAAYAASTAGPEPESSGYAVVDAAGVTPEGGAGERECDHRTGGSGSTAAPDSPDSTDSTDAGSL